MPLRVESQAEPIPGYRLLERLGGGGFGEVWKAEAPGGLHKAIKIIHGDLRTANGDNSRLAEQELRALKRVQSVRHPYLLSLERYDIVDGRLLIVMELADCNLWDRFREYRAQGQVGIPRAEVLRYMEESAEVLDMMNSQHQLQHLDIKPQNLFLIYNHVKVADFGLVKDLEGMRAEMTGGVTPVYAAPETFDGIVTRFCDQYSLAIVYQELLTGVRPFSGGSLQQLLMQHLQAPPNLNPLPVSDRPVLSRALAKKPEDRFPTCIAMVRALQQAGSEPAVGSAANAPAAARAETPAKAGWSTVPPLPPTSAAPGGAAASLPPLPAPAETPRTIMGNRPPDTGAHQAPEWVQPERIAPPEVQGNGALFPAVIIGLGGQAGTVLRYFRRQLMDRFGPFENLSNLRLIYVETDPAVIQEATEGGGRSAFASNDVISARLNRPGHYLKPRRNGRSLIEGWFDPQMLYRIPRNPETLGMRALGRLAYCDHFRTISNRLRESLEATTHPDALADAARATGLALRTNRPRVYVVAGLGGGTGGGMFLDMAYTARLRLRQLGYTDPEVVGILIAPPPEHSSQNTAALSNCYAALRELNHFTLPNTVFRASYDDRDSQVSDKGPPFSRLYLLPGPGRGQGNAPGATSSQRETFGQLAEFLRRELTTPLGRAADHARQRPAPGDSPGVTVHSFSARSFTWPRQVVLTGAARWLSETMLARWMATDPAHMTDAVRAWLAQRWDAEELGPEAAIATLQRAVEKAAGQSPDDLFAAEAQPFVPRGWFARDPDSAKLWQAVGRLQQLVGNPDDHAMQRQVGKWELVLSDAADQVGRQSAARAARLISTLLEDPAFRLGGAEQAVKQVHGTIDRLLQHYEPLAIELGNKAIDAVILLQNFVAGASGKRKPSPAELAEALKQFPKWRYQCLVLRQVCRVFLTVRNQLADQLREVRFCRQRLEELNQRVRQAAVDTPSADSFLLPAGCTSVAQAIDNLKRQVTPEDLAGLDKQLQAQIEREFQGLFSACMTSVNVLGSFQTMLEEQCRTFLSSRQGEHDLVEMFLERYGTAEGSARALRVAYDEAAPTIVRPSHVDRGEVCLLGLPPGEQGEPFHHVAQRALANIDVEIAAIGDEILVHREYTRLALTDLPQLGPLAEKAYTQAQSSNTATPHTRTDVGEWADVEPE